LPPSTHALALGGPCALLGDDVDHAGDGVGSVQGRLRSADDLDPLDGVDVNSAMSVEPSVGLFVRMPSTRTSARWDPPPRMLKLVALPG
jgi:hypothetical protein